MKYIIDLPDKEIREYVLKDRLTIPIQVGITKDCLSFDTLPDPYIPEEEQ